MNPDSACSPFPIPAATTPTPQSASRASWPSCEHLTRCQRLYLRSGHWLQQNGVFETDISPFLRLTIHWYCLETSLAGTIWRLYLWCDVRLNLLSHPLHRSLRITKEDPQLLLQHFSPLVLAPPQPPYRHAIRRHLPPIRRRRTPERAG